MPSSMTIITVTQELSEARGCRKCSSTKTKFKNTILPASITRAFIVTYITHTECNRKFKAKRLKTMPFTNNG